MFENTLSKNADDLQLQAILGSIPQKEMYNR